MVARDDEELELSGEARETLHYGGTAAAVYGSADNRLSEGVAVGASRLSAPSFRESPPPTSYGYHYHQLLVAPAVR